MKFPESQNSTKDGWFYDFTLLGLIQKEMDMMGVGSSALEEIDDILKATETVLRRMEGL
jgi:hypothetical protein